MTRRILTATGLILLWAILVIAAFVANAYWRTPVSSDGKLATIESHLVRKLRNAAEGRKLGSAALVLLRNGEIAAAHGFGVGNVRTGAAPNPERTLYQVASVSKAVTAWGVLKLVQDGKLELDEPVLPHLRRWRFPGSDGAWRNRVTVRQLLTHTSGLDDGRGYAPSDQTLEGSLANVFIAREPGASFAYSSAAYAVLQLLIEEITQQPFDTSMKTVLQPLGMTRSSFDLAAITAEGRVGELATSFDQRLEPVPHRRLAAQAPVSLYATAHDLARFAQAFVKPNPVLNRATVKAMLAPQPMTSGTWGLGLTLFVPPGSGASIVGHDGGTVPAWGAMVRVNPRTGNGMVLVVSGGRGAINQLGHDWVYWETGKLAPGARRQVLMDRLVPVSLTIVLGVFVIALGSWRGRRRRA